MKPKGRTSLFSKIAVYTVLVILVLVTFLSAFGFVPPVKKAHAVGNTYYIREDGTATKANAIGPSTDSTKCMSVATHNAATFSAGDTILFSDKSAGAYGMGVMVPSSGIVGSPITYDVVPGETPNVASAGQNPFLINGKSYIDIKNIHMTSLSALSYAGGISLMGSAHNVNITNVTITMSSVGFYVVSDGSNSNITIDGLTGTGAGNHGIYMYGTGNSNITIKNSAMTGGTSIYLKDIATLTVQNVTHTNSVTAVPDLQIINGSGVLTVDTYTSTSSAGIGISVATSAYSAGSIIKNCTVINSTDTGYSATTSSGFTFQNNIGNGLPRGFLLTDSHDISLVSNTANNSTSTYGFGIYGTSYNITLTSNIANANYTNGFGIYGTSYNITLTSNIANANHTNGYIVYDTSHDLTFTSNTANLNLLSGFLVSAFANTITFTSNTSTNAVTANYNGFEVAGQAHDITFTSNTASVNAYDGWLLAGSAYNITFTSNTASSNNGIGFRITSSVHNVTYNSDVADGNQGAAGFYALNTSYNITYNNCITRNNVGDGFAVLNAVHDVTYNGCLSTGNGTKSTVSEGDGFTAHETNYNIFINNSISSLNTASGYAMVGTSSGRIYNSIAYQNAGNWLADGSGIDQVRGGFDIPTTAANPTSGVGWVVKNCIGQGNYPREINLAATSVVTFDYNIYLPTSDTRFASLDVATTNISWATYHASYETNSLNADPKFINAPTDFRLLATSPAIDAGTNLGLVTDYAGNPVYGARDIGAYEYQPPFVMAADEMDIGAGARIYENGNFRNLGAVASNTSAKLSITPPSGSFPAGDLSAWMDVTSIIWNNTGTHHKAWTETSTVSGLNNTIHTVGDLEPNKYYNVKVDNVLGVNMTGTNCVAGLCLSNNNGAINFTYTGGYSTHTFDVEGEPATVASSGSSTSTTPSTPVAKFPETGVHYDEKSIFRNIVVLAGLLALVLTSLIVVLRKRRKI